MILQVMVRMVKPKMKKVVVIGSNSFTGSSFINHALENSNAEIIGISRSPEYNPIFLAYLYKKKRRPKNFEFYQLDLNKDFDSLVNLIDKFEPDVIVNYAAEGEVRNSWKWPEQWFNTNCLSIVRFSNVLKDKHYLKRYVSISTPEVYGSTPKKVAENFTFKPSTPYAASKLAGDLFLYALFKRYNFPVIYTRSANVYGMHQQLYRIIPRTIIYLKLGKKIDLHGEGKAKRSFVHVRDVADATFRIIENGNNGEVYHIASNDKIYEIKEIVNMICKFMDYNFEKSVNLIKENYGQDYLYSLDNTKIKKELGWKTKISLEGGIKETINWIEHSWKEIKKQPLDYIHKTPEIKTKIE